MSKPIPTDADPIVGLHYRLYAYVCGAACIQTPPHTDAVTFTTVFNERPAECRFAVVQRIPLRVEKDASKGLFKHTAAEGPYVVWDLLDEELVRGRRTGPGGFMSPPPAWFLCDNEDGAVMKAMMFYGQA